MWRKRLIAGGAGIGAVLLLSLFVHSPAAGQNAAGQNSDSSAPPEITIRSDSTLVEIPVSVTDSLNRFILGMQKDDFHITEDGAEQTIVHFSGDDAPLSVGLLFDESGSMDFKMRNAQAAINLFLKTFNPEDEAFLVEFSDTAKLSVGFTSKPADIENQLKTINTGGLTAMLDAIHLALAEMKKAKAARKAIVIISDGGDNHSQYKSSEIESLVREANVQIYAMGVFEPDYGALLGTASGSGSASLAAGKTPEEVSGPRLLSEITSQTGGRAFSAALTGDLPAVASRIAIELRNQYVLGYYPSNHTRDGKYRKVEVKVTQPPGINSVKAHWRLGYYSPAE